MRLDKYLHDMGFGSRREIDALIKRRAVTVDGEVAKKSAMSVHEASVVVVSGEEVTYQEHVWLMMNKPKDTITAVSDKTSATVMDYLPERFARMKVVPVGRLDKDTTGLLLFTNDGQMAHKLTSPKHEVAKTYDIIYEESLCDDAEVRIEEGLDLGDFTSAPARLERLGEGRARLAIREGKFHQVKRMMHEVGAVVVGLHRISIGNLTLDASLAEGAWRTLTAEEIEGLTK